MFMQDEFTLLKMKIEMIKNKNWIKLNGHGYGEPGMLFEKELGLNNNDFSVPDFNSIEIKVKSRASKYPITLFSSTCDGPSFYELKRIVKKYGIKDINFNNKFLFITLSGKNFAYWGRFLKMKLHIDRERQKVFILICHSNGKIIECKSYWEFSTLKKILERKLKFLCYVNYDVTFHHETRFVKFDLGHFFKFKNFDNFIKLMENGDIFINIKFGMYKNGPKLGKSHDHGTAFQIKTEAIPNLFEEINI